MEMLRRKILTVNKIQTIIVINIAHQIRNKRHLSFIKVINATSKKDAEFLQ
jgi:hypothetical protein